MTTTYLAQETSAGNPILNISIFGIFLVVTMAVVLRAGKTTKKASDFYTGGGSFSGRQNGLAISGDYLSAASFLGICGAIAINGYDGFLYSIGFLVAWLVALLLVAELMRNTGKFTMADVLSFRLKQGPVRMAAAITTLAVCFFYLLAQMAGAGGLVGDEDAQLVADDAQPQHGVSAEGVGDLRAGVGGEGEVELGIEGSDRAGAGAAAELGLRDGDENAALRPVFGERPGGYLHAVEVVELDDVGDLIVERLVRGGIDRGAHDGVGAVGARRGRPQGDAAGDGRRRERGDSAGEEQASARGRRGAGCRGCGGGACCGVCGPVPVRVGGLAGTRTGVGVGRGRHERERGQGRWRLDRRCGRCRWRDGRLPHDAAALLEITQSRERDRIVVDVGIRPVRTGTQRREFGVDVGHGLTLPGRTARGSWSRSPTRTRGRRLRRRRCCRCRSRTSRTRRPLAGCPAKTAPWGVRWCSS